MKKLALPRHRAKREKTYLVSPETAVKYVIEFLFMILFFSSGEFGFALSLGLFAGLVYARQNLAVVAPLFVIAGCVFIKSWWLLLYLATPCLIFFVLYFVYWKIRRNVQSVVVVISAVVSALPESVCTLVFGGEIWTFCVKIVVVAIMALCCTTAGYAVLIRGFKCRFTLDEKICLGLIAVVSAYSARGVDVCGFSLVYLLFPFVLLTFISAGRTTGALVSGVLFGVGASLSQGSVLPLAEFVAISFSACAVGVLGRYVSAVVAGIAELVFWLLSAGCWQGAILLVAGGLVYSILPSSVRSRFVADVENRADVLCSVVNRDRSELAEKLSSVGEVFADMADALEVKDNAVNPYTPKRLAGEIARNYCGKCAEHPKCFASLGGDTAPVIEPLAQATLGRGKATILDVPTFITSRCVKVHNLIGVVNNAGDAYRARIASAGDAVNTKKMMSEQFAGMALVLDSLSAECGKNLSFGGEYEEKISAELLKHNVVASRIVVAGDGENAKVALTVRDVDADKAVLPRVVSRCLKARFAVDGIERKGDEKTVHLVTAPVYEIAYGFAGKEREGEDVSGDVKAVLSPSLTKRIFALCDGMGSGEKASATANDAMSMIENFYRAGFEDGIILSLVNRLLRLGDDENFSALDVVIIDTADGGADIIKMGAAPGFIVRKNSVEVVKSSNPPVGIIDKISPITARYQLYDGDILVCATDGVLDVLGESGVIDAVDKISTTNPQTLADGILVEALRAGATDDCTVMAMRLVAV